MPTYEYACKSCGQHLEVVQSFKDNPLTECPNCGGALRKVFGNIGITFKGSGFYKTDSRGDRKTAGSPAKSEVKASESKPSDGSSSASGSSSSSPGASSSGPGGSGSGASTSAVA